jgi:predicted phosphoribosyltransferase
LAIEDPIVVAVPRGGVPVADEIAMALDASLEILAVRKVGAPHNPEYGIGAIAEDGTRVFDLEALAALDVDGATLESMVERETAELRRRMGAYRGERAPRSLAGRAAIVVDDGVATGVTDTVALRAARRQGPRRLLLAVPVCARDSLPRLRDQADEVVCLIAPPLLYGVGQWYRDFAQVSDEEVIAALAGRSQA